MERQRVMIVDDDEAFLEETAELLREAGYSLRTADSHDSALAILGNGNLLPEIILLDHVFLGNGGNLLKKLKSNDRTSAIPVVVISGTPLEDITGDLADISEKPVVHAFMEKPLNPLDIIAVIETNLNSG
jgi:response regulator RpfG family c-di-GMP phosphodiesterase